VPPVVKAQSDCKGDQLNTISSPLVDVHLSATLSALALIMLIGILLLSGPITGKPCNGAANSTSNAVSDATAQVAKLSLCLLSLASGVLLAALALEVLTANQVANRFLATADGLVPGALATVTRVFGWNTRRAQGVWPGLNSGVRSIFLSFSFGFGLVGVGLVAGAACDGGDARLYCACPYLSVAVSG
jgi:hypothetical protein